jgi:hypothetical protein
MTERGPQACDFSRGSRAFPLPGGVAARMVVSPSCDDVSVSTSQCCAVCGHTSPRNRKGQAVFGCGACGYEANADVNAAVNILAAGLAVTARGGTSRGKGPDEARTQPVAV